MKKFLLLFFILPCFTLLHAQKDMIPGYVVKTNSDTLRGFIRERSDWSRPFIDFARAANGEPERIAFTDLTMLYLKPYESYYYKTIVNIDKKTRVASKLETTPGRRIVVDTVLLHSVVTGAINLYDYEDESGKQHFFVEGKVNQIQELDYVVFKNADLKFVEMRYYVETLRSMLSDCDKVKSTDIRYDKASFAKVIKDYNSCFGTTNSAVENAGSQIRMGVFAGGGSTTVSFSGSDLKSSPNAAASNSKFSNVTSIMAGLSLEVMSRRAASRIIPGFNIMYQKTGTSTASNQDPIHHNDLSANFSFLHVGVGVKLILNPRNKLQAYIKAVGNLALVMDHKTTYTSTNIYTKDVSAPAPFALPNNVGFSAGGGAGITFGPVDAEVNYLSNIVATKAAPSCQLGNLYFTIGYRFIHP